jgi:hypothetical protein
MIGLVLLHFLAGRGPRLLCTDTKIGLKLSTLKTEFLLISEICEMFKLRDAFVNTGTNTCVDDVVRNAVLFGSVLLVSRRLCNNNQDKFRAHR